tara:strand:+ start:2239 stop:2877 length:639 start_codon:yes stop_codon:yes gene_type:complete
MIRWIGLLIIPFVGPILAFTVGPFMGARRGALYFPSKKRPLSLYLIGFSWAVFVPFVLTMVLRTFLGPTFVFGVAELIISSFLFLLIFSSFLLGLNSTKVFTIQERLDGMGWDDDLDDFTDDISTSKGSSSTDKNSKEWAKDSWGSRVENKLKSNKSNPKSNTSKSITSKAKKHKTNSSKKPDFLESLEEKEEDEDSQPSVFSVLAQKRRQK